MEDFLKFKKENVGNPEGPHILLNKGRSCGITVTWVRAHCILYTYPTNICIICLHTLFKKYINCGTFIILTGLYTNVWNSSPPLTLCSSFCLPPGYWSRKIVCVNKPHVWRGSTYSNTKLFILPCLHVVLKMIISNGQEIKIANYTHKTFIIVFVWLLFEK